MFKFYLITQQDELIVYEQDLNPTQIKIFQSVDWTVTYIGKVILSNSIKGIVTVFDYNY